MGLPHFYFVFLAINFALNSEMSSATRHRSIRASFLNQAEHLQSYVRNNSSSSGLRNGKDATTEKHAFLALMPWQMRSLSDDRVLPARKKLSRRSRSPLSTSLSNFRREWIPEQTGLVLVGKTKREVRGLSKLFIDHDGLNRHTESYRQKLFGPHAVKPSLYPLPFSFTGLPLPLYLSRSADRRSPSSLPPGPSSREDYQASLALVAGRSVQRKDQLLEHKHAPTAPPVRVPGKPAQGKDQLLEHKQAPLAHHKRAPLALMAGEPSKGEDQRMEHKQAPIAHPIQAPLVRVTEKPAQGEDQLLEHKQEPIAQLKQAPLALMVGEPSKGKDQLLENNHDQAFLALVTGKPAQGKDHLLVWGAHVAPSAKKSQAVTSGNVDRSQFVLSIGKNAGLGIGNLSQQENTGKVIFSDRKSPEQGSSDSQKIIGDGFQGHFKRKKNRADHPSDNRRARWGNFHDRNGAKKNKAQQPPSNNKRTRRERPPIYVRIVSLKHDLMCLGMFIAGHKYFGFDPRKGNEVTWRYRKMGFYTSFPRPRLKKLHPAAVEACKDYAVRCLQVVSAFARRSSILQDTACVKKTTSKIDRPRDAGPYYPFDSALDLFRYRTSVSYFLCWYAIKRTWDLKKMYADKSCLESLELNTLREPLNNQKSILDFRDDTVAFQCAMLAFCPDPCFGRKTKGIVPDKAFVAGRDPGNPCRGLKDQTCGWNLPHNIQFEDLQRNRFNISCNCEKEKPGFAWNSKYHLCVDVDECLNEKTRIACGRAGNMRCQNTVGSFKCMCQQGFLRNQETRKCEEHVKIPRPVFNHSLTNARHLQKILQSEGSGTFLWKEIEAALGLSSGCQHYPGMLWLLCNLIVVCFHRGNAV